VNSDVVTASTSEQALKRSFCSTVQYTACSFAMEIFCLSLLQYAVFVQTYSVQPYGGL
jgi:hypothetical protein